MRFTSFRAAFAAAVAGAAFAGIFACSSTTTETSGTATADGGISRDADTVDVFGSADAAADTGAPPPPLSCTKYCDLIQKHCEGPHAQYASVEDCLAFCTHLPAGDPFDAKETAGLYCRQYYAGNPTLTDPEAYCAAAGPFGGGVCGDRCTAFCDVTLSACSPDAGAAAPYATSPACKTACVEYTYRDAGTDGGGETLDGPSNGDTLNCRLYHLREAVKDGGACEDLGPDAGACRW